MRIYPERRVVRHLISGRLWPPPRKRSKNLHLLQDFRQPCKERLIGGTDKEEIILFQDTVPHLLSVSVQADSFPEFSATLSHEYPAACRRRPGSISNKPGWRETCGVLDLLHGYTGLFEASEQTPFWRNRTCCTFRIFSGTVPGTSCCKMLEWVWLYSQNVEMRG